MLGCRGQQAVGNDRRLTTLPDLAAAEARPGLLLLAAAAAVVRLIACVTVVLLLLGQMVEREWGFGIRTVLGAGFRALDRQSLRPDGTYRLEPLPLTDQRGGRDGAAPLPACRQHRTF
jgi:hypothetical protein